MDSSASDEKSITAILTFWFEETSPEAWFKKDTLFDGILMQKFGRIVEQALAGQLDNGPAKDGRLSFFFLIKTRNIYRNTPKAFAHEIACALFYGPQLTGQLKQNRYT